MGRLARLLALLWVALALLSACSATQPEPVTLRVLASSELADLVPLLTGLRAATGVELELDLRGTIDATNALTPGDYRHDLAWLSSDRYFQLKLLKSGYAGPKPLSNPIMLSPVAIGVKRATAGRLGADGPVSWASIADHAAAGELRFAMGDPRHTGSGLAALIGVATAAAGTGRALRPEDVTCDRLRGLFAGHQRAAGTSTGLVDEFVAHQGELDALVSYESVLLSLNDSGRLAEPLEIIYPADGIVQSEYPLLLLDPAKRAAYDRVVEWLLSEPVQQQIMERTARRPIDPDVPRSSRLPDATGNSLYFPDQPEVIDSLLANYTDAGPPGHVIFLLDFSGSMRGTRIAALRSAFADLTGTGQATFARFYQGERFTVVRFGAQVLAEREFASGEESDLAALREFVGTDSFDDSTAVWSTVDHAYDLATAITATDARRPVSIVLMTDGLSNTGLTVDDFLARYRSRGSPVPTFAIRVGEADAAELAHAAAATGGHMVDAGADALPAAFKEIRGCR